MPRMMDICIWVYASKPYWDMTSITNQSQYSQLLVLMEFLFIDNSDAH